MAAQGIEADEDMAQLGMTYPAAGMYLLNLRLHAPERIRWLQMAMTAARRFNDRQCEGVVLGNLGLAYYDLGDYRPAIQCFEQQLTIFRKPGDRKGEGDSPCH